MPSSGTPATFSLISLRWNALAAAVVAASNRPDGQPGQAADEVQLLLDHTYIVRRPVTLLEPLHRECMNEGGHRAIADLALQPSEFVLRSALPAPSIRLGRSRIARKVHPIGHGPTITALERPAHASGRMVPEEAVGSASFSSV
jgi:hypothetical protein